MIATVSKAFMLLRYLARFQKDDRLHLCVQFYPESVTGISPSLASTAKGHSFFDFMLKVSVANLLETFVIFQRLQLIRKGSEVFRSSFFLLENVNIILGFI